MSVASIIEIRTPGFVLSEMSTIDNSLKSLIRDVGESEAPQQFRNGLREYADEWVKFYNDNASGMGAWWARGTTPVYNKTVEYKLRLQKWQDTFVSIGGKLTQPVVPEVKTGLPRWVVLGGIAGLVGGGLYLMNKREERLARKALPPWRQGT